MITTNDIRKMLKMLSANYGEEFYRGTDESDVLTLWSVQFANDDPKEVMQAVMNCISTLSFKPKIADIRQRMGQAKMQGQMTTIEAFQTISKAVRDSYNRESAVKAYNALPPILQKLAGFPEQLISWHNVSDESFQTVIMSAIRESYRELAKFEADYHALPKALQKAEKWRMPEPQQAALPKADVVKSIQEIIDEANAKAAEHGMVMTPELEQKHKAQVSAFLAPMTDAEQKLYDAKQKKKEADRLERMR